MRTSGLIFNSTFLVGVTPAQTINAGFEGAIAVSTTSGLDPAISAVQVCLKAGATAGSGYIVVHSSKVITNNATLGQVSLPAGEYIVRVQGGSSIIGCISLSPTI